MRTVQALKRSVDLLLAAIQFRGNQENFMKQTAKALRSMALGSAVLSIVGCVSAPVSPATIEAELMEADMAYDHPGAFCKLECDDFRFSLCLVSLGIGCAQNARKTACDSEDEVTDSHNLFSSGFEASTGFCS